MNNTVKKRALITGITGMDGSHIADLLLSKDYEVYGMIRRSSTNKLDRIEHIKDKVNILYGDLQDSGSLYNVVQESNPDEIYNMAAQSHVRISFDMPEYTMDVTGSGVIRLLEVIKKFNKSIKLYHASSSEMFGNEPGPQNEDTKFSPASPYAIAKVAAHQAVVNYRKSYDMFTCCGILFNHTGERRGDNFVTRKITKGIANIINGKQEKLKLGNLSSSRDWGYARDYCEAIYMMMQNKNPDDYVIGTGRYISVHEFIDRCFKYVNIKDWHNYIEIDKSLYRPVEVNHLCADPSKAKRELGWSPKTDLDQIVKIMIDNDVKLAKEFK
jgi:GDPmannose 4,6-dehydratase